MGPLSLYFPFLALSLVLGSAHLSFSYPIRDWACDSLREDGCHCSAIWDDEASCCCSGRGVTQIPQTLWRNVTRLIMKRVGITRIRSADFEGYTSLTQIEVVQAPELALIEANAFGSLARLKKLSLRDCPKLDRIDGYLIDRKRELLTLEIKRTGITSIPRMKMVMNSLSPPAIDFAENEITSIETGEVDNILVSGLRLSHNRITYIADYAFRNSKIFVLSLDNNPLTEISPNAFAGIAALTKLDLSYTELQALPEEGLGQVEVLDVQNTPSLKQLPPLVVFMNLKEAKLHYPYHCCLFKYAPASARNLKLHAKKYEGNLQELREKYCVTPSSASTPTPTPTPAPVPTTPKLTQSPDEASTDLGSGDSDPDDHTLARPRRSSHSNKWDAVGQFGVFYDDEESEEKTQAEDGAVWSGPVVQQSSGKNAAIKSSFVWGTWHDPEEEVDEEATQRPTFKNRRPVGSMLIPSHLEGIVWEPMAVSVPSVVVPCIDGDRYVNEYYANVTCTPQPDALNPCEDVMIGWHLRILMFFVWIAAIVGNLLVILVLFIATQPRQRVNNFLMLNLAFADLCTGVYLAMLAITDVTTRGEYYNYAVAWQTGWGCKIAGTLTVFASELSIVTMVMISFEVWYNTKHAIFQKRLSLSLVFPVMLGGWLMAGTLAALPLLGVSDYSVTSTCLPLRLVYPRDRAYLTTCLGLNVLGFAYIVFNYVSVYCTVARSKAATAHAQDVALAKLMFCLIFTDFLCWAPTVFFGLTAAAKVPLISISIAKVFLVLFYPLNAFANPWLYVFLTKRFRKNASRFIRKHVWLHELLSNTLRHHHSHPHDDDQDLHGTSGNNYFYQSEPHNPTQTTNLTSHRSLPSTWSSALITPRGSKASLPHTITTDSTPRSGSSGSCNEMLIATETSTLLLPSSTASVFGNGIGTGTGSGATSNGILARRRSTTPRFRPHMSDIIENSNSNSTEDDQKHSPPLLLFQASKAPGRRGSRWSEDEGAGTTEIELKSFEGLHGDPRDPTGDPHLPRHDSSGRCSMESGYCTTTPLLLTPDSTIGASREASWRRDRPTGRLSLT